MFLVSRKMDGLFHTTWLVKETVLPRKQTFPNTVAGIGYLISVNSGDFQKLNQTAVDCVHASQGGSSANNFATKPRSFQLKDEPLNVLYWKNPPPPLGDVVFLSRNLQKASKVKRFRGIFCASRITKSPNTFMVTQATKRHHNTVENERARTGARKNSSSWRKHTRPKIKLPPKAAAINFSRGKPASKPTQTYLPSPLWRVGSKLAAIFFSPQPDFSTWRVECASSLRGL